MTDIYVPELEVISGPMFSGKTEELLKRLGRLEIAKLNVAAFKPSLDDRYAVGEIASHGGARREAVVIENPNEIYDHLSSKIDVVGIDEGQFLGSDLARVCHELVKDFRVRTLVSALNTDYKGLPWEYDDGSNIGSLIALANRVDYLEGICTYPINGKCCPIPATRTQRLSSDEGTVVVGGIDKYAARCMQHFVPGK